VRVGSTDLGSRLGRVIDQLDRLDGIIDCLADGLNGAVRDAVRDGSRAALRDLLAEALADPATLAALR
jgi:hypothetical protein